MSRKETECFRFVFLTFQLLSKFTKIICSKILQLRVTLLPVTEYFSNLFLKISFKNFLFNLNKVKPLLLNMRFRCHSEIVRVPSTHPQLKR